MEAGGGAALAPLVGDDLCETTTRVNAIADAELELSKRHGASTGQMKALHRDFRKTLMDID